MARLLGGVDVEGVLVSIIGLGAFVGACVAGVKAGIKKVRGEAEETPRIIGGTIMGSVEIAMLTERLREHSEVTRESIAATRENTSAQHETAHQIERLRDRMS